MHLLAGALLFLILHSIPMKLNYETKNYTLKKCNKTLLYLFQVVGFTTSGTYGYTVNYSIAFAYLPPFLSVSGTKVQVELLGELCDALVLPGAPVEIESVRQKKKSKSL